jgi:anti-sigma factor RsiW
VTHLGDLLSALLDGELDAAGRRRAGAHLAECEPCRIELSRVDSARMALRGLPVLEAPTGVIPRGRRPRLLSPAWGTAVAAAAALVVGLAVGPGTPDATVPIDTLGDQHNARVVGDPGIATFRGGQP